MDADGIIAALGLSPHPEGGYYREFYRDPQTIGGRSRSTAIWFLLRAGEVSRWHRVDAVEVWHFHTGSPLLLEVARAGGMIDRMRLGIALADGELPTGIVPAGAWQSARSLGAFTLVGCTVAPGFEFSGFELAPEGWNP